MNPDPSSATLLRIGLSQRPASQTAILLFLLALPVTSRAQFLFETNANAITITAYTGPGGEVDIPGTITDLPVVSIQYQAFGFSCPLCTLVTAVTIPNSVTNIGGGAFSSCPNLTNLALGNGVIFIGMDAFRGCPLTSITLPNSLRTMASGVFYGAPLTSVTLPDSLTYLGIMAFEGCGSLTNVTIGNGLRQINGLTFTRTALTGVTIPDNVTNIGNSAFERCTRLTSVTIGTNLASIDYTAFQSCTNLRALYFKGNAPSLGSAVFDGDTNATVYYLPGTTGWGPTFGGLPTVMWNPPVIQKSPRTQTAEAGSAVGLWVKATGGQPLMCLWYLSQTNPIAWGTNCQLTLTNVQYAQAGAYTVIVTNACGAVTGSPAALSVIPPVGRRTAPGFQVTGNLGTMINLDYANALSATPAWLPLDTITLSGTSQYYFDLTLPVPSRRFYQAWPMGTPGVGVPLSLPGLFSALTLTGSIGNSVRVDYINRYGPTDAWVTLDTVKLTSPSQLYFDTSAPGQPERLYRLVPVP
jgi:hypothetical protein